MGGSGGRAELPDFVIIGAMKSATSTLQEQLSAQPGIFMCTPKEPNFFSDDEQFARGLGWYTGLFSAANGADLLGEASTHYTKLPTYPDTVERLARYLPAARFIYVMRHPVDRLVSHYIHEWSMGVYSCDIEAAIDRYSELVDYGLYGMQLKPYFETFGRDRVLPVFFDRLVSEPQRELERVCRFIGYRSEPVWRNDLGARNVSSQRIRRFPMYGMVVESPVATWLRRNLIPRSVREAVKGRLTMRQRPALSAEGRSRLERRFDQDLWQLGEWLGISLSCANFKEVTRDRVLDWVDDRE